ncbi:general transcription factor II-I repeat domain-containing protein 2A [Trichonephila clavipes]|nr:general transcription factor II-I repeat domain-containing protein 2A [Trichonephila clavipes]
MKDRILKLAENVTDQQKNDINSASFISLCLDESFDITKSARLAVFARYCVVNIIKEELIAITSLLTTTKCTDICTAVRNSLAEKEIDLKKIVSVTTDGAPNMVGKKCGRCSLVVKVLDRGWLVRSSSTVPLKTRHNFLVTQSSRGDDRVCTYFKSDSLNSLLCFVPENRQNQKEPDTRLSFRLDIGVLALVCRCNNLTKRPGNFHFSMDQSPNVDVPWHIADAIGDVVRSAQEHNSVASCVDP